MSTSTPPYAPPAIRAITTPLVARATPPIPCAEALYVPLAQRVLRRRLTHTIFLYTLLNTHNNFTATSVLRWLGMGLLGWMCGVLPVLLVRKAFLTVTHTSVSSPLLLLQNSFAIPALRTRTLHMLQAYVFSALSVLALHATLDASTSLFVRSRKHPWTPHPALLFLGGTQTVLAALYATPRATPPDVARPRAKVVASFPPPPRARPPIQIQNPLANAKNTYGRHVSWSSLLPPFVSFVRSQFDDDRAAVSSATLRGRRCCWGAAALSPPRTRFLSAAQVHTPQTRFLHPKLLIASGAGAFRDAGSQCGGMAVSLLLYQQPRVLPAPTGAGLARYGLRRARLVASWRGVGYFMARF
ncbi:hypothetical protein C8J57DRAFT_1651274 [Mycena rebaudengoi]|nr:hypothetical protein C8J57DRAFT_1651274 [Mycena rebaudengoi]